MRTCVIVNPNAGSAQQFERVRNALEELEDTVCWPSNEPGQVAELAARAAREGFDCVAAAGGDGTIHEAVNGLMAEGGGPVLAIVPVGTGNDLARLLDVPEDPRAAVALIRAGEVIALDLFHASDGERACYGINAAAGGFSGEVGEALTPELKESWGPLAYLLGAVSALPGHKLYEARITIDDGPEEPFELLNMFVANGRTVGGGRRVAPVADPADGLLDVVLLRSGTLVNLAEIGARLMAGGLLESPNVVHRRARSIRVASEPGMLFNVDGELFTDRPMQFDVLPGVLRVVVGPDYGRVPVPAVRTAP